MADSTTSRIPSFPFIPCPPRAGAGSCPENVENRREDQVIRAIPISEAGPVLHEDESDPEMPEHDPYRPNSSMYHKYLFSLRIPMLAMIYVF